MMFRDYLAGRSGLGFVTGLPVGRRSGLEYGRGRCAVGRPRCRVVSYEKLSSIEWDPPIDIITQGPVYRKAGLNKNGDGIDWGEWFARALVLNKYLGREANIDRVHKYYLPLYVWLKQQLAQINKSGEKTVVVGLSCPQGGGKTTITRFLSKLFAIDGISCAVASTDDFYLTRAQQQALHEDNKSNPLLEFRGNPGTVDIDLMVNTMQEITNAKAGNKVEVPRYDKSAFGGLGDRAPQSEWATAKGPVDLLIVEGWCLGFQPVDNPSDENVAQINEYLRDFSRVYDMLDLLVVVQISNPECVYSWRKQAEDAMKKKGKSGMSNAQLKEFVDRFMPAYKEYLPGLYSNSVRAGLPQLNIKIDENRKPID